MASYIDLIYGSQLRVDQKCGPGVVGVAFGKTGTALQTVITTAFGETVILTEMEAMRYVILAVSTLAVPMRVTQSTIATLMMIVAATAAITRKAILT